MLAERPVILFGKYHGKPEGSIEIDGTGREKSYKKVFDVSKIKPDNLNRALQYLWARKRIEKLSDFNFGKIDSDTKSEITSIGLTYNLLTKFTSFVAVNEEIINSDGQAINVKQPLPLPKGVSKYAVGVSMVKTPEPEIYLILAALFIVFIIRRKRGWVN